MEQVEMFVDSTDYTGTLQLIEVPIKVGDFVRAKDMPMVCGFVLGKGSIPFGRKRVIEGYKVRLTNGRVDFISADDCEFISRPD